MKVFYINQYRKIIFFLKFRVYEIKLNIYLNKMNIYYEKHNVICCYVLFDENLCILVYKCIIYMFIIS